MQKVITESPDQYHDNDKHIHLHHLVGACVFITTPSFRIWSKNSRSTHFDILKAVKLSRKEDKKYWVNPANVKGEYVDDQGMNTFFEGDFTKYENYFYFGRMSRITIHKYASEKAGEEAMLGRIWTKERIASFWNPLATFKLIDFQSATNFIKNNLHIPPNTVTYEVSENRDTVSSYHGESVFQNYSLLELTNKLKNKTVEDEPKERPKLSDALHTVAPQFKGNMMKAMGIQPKVNPLSIQQRFALGQESFVPNNFDDFLDELFLEAAALKTPEQYNKEKFENVLKTIQDSLIENGFKLYATDEAFYNHHLIARMHSILKNNTQMEYFLFWLKADFLYKIRRYLSKALEVYDPGNEKVGEEHDNIKNAYKQIWDYLNEEINRLSNKGKKRGLQNLQAIQTLPNSPNTFLHQMEHSMSLNIHAIDNYNFFSGFPTPNELSNIFRRIEKEYYKKFEGNLVEKDLGEDEETILEFSLDGNNFLWVNTHTSQTCDREAKLMHHCGNSYHANRKGDEIFSLREKLTIDNTLMFKPILTFVVNDSTLRESKGSANDKPSPKYHKHIVELLKTGEIKHIFQKDSHKAQNNFYFNDLSPEYQKEVQDKFEEEKWDFKLDDESMNFDKQIEESEKLVKDANKDFKFVDLRLENDNDYITYYLWGSFSLPFLNAEFWDKYEDYFDNLKGYTDGSSDGMKYDEYTNEQGETRNYIKLNFDMKEHFSLETGEGQDENGHGYNDITSLTKEAVRSAEYIDKEIKSTINDAIDKILLNVTDNPNTQTEINKNLNLLTNFLTAIHASHLQTKFKEKSFELIFSQKINEYLTNNTISEENQNLLKTKIKNYIKQYFELFDQGKHYGPVDLFKEPFPSDENFSNLDTIKIETRIANDSYYSPNREKFYVVLDIPNTLYNFLNKYITQRFFTELYTNVDKFIIEYMDKEDKIKKESFRSFVQNRMVMH